MMRLLQIEPIHSKSPKNKLINLFLTYTHHSDLFIL